MSSATDKVDVPVSTASTSEPKADDSSHNNNNNNNKRNAPSEKRTSRKNFKKSKREAAANHTRRGQHRDPRDYDENRDDRDRPTHEGSYANPGQRKLLGVDDSILEQNRIVVPPEAKTVKRKAALLLGFLGTNYSGFQINAGQKTIQAEIELALFKAGLLSEMNFGYPFKYSWSSSARTDKGVHACAQVCSAKLILQPPAGEETELPDSCWEEARLNIEKQLPEQIRVLDLVRTTRNFCAKTQRDRVRYQYMIPSFMLHPSYRSLLEEHGIPLEGRREVARNPLNPEELKKLASALNAYRSTPEQRARLQDAFRKYEGTRPFHNFTKGLKPGQPQASRYIESFIVQDPVVFDDGIEWIPTQVLGQSFLLHQIRKMVSLAVDVTRGAASLELMDKALSKTEVVCVGLAPAQGLFLEMSYFGGYNRRKGSQNPDMPDLDFLEEGPTRKRWEDFRTKIRKHIVEEEVSQGNFLQYLYQQECLFDYENLFKMEGLSGGEEGEAEDDC
eukprot:Nitzschia sp. Nitz4//scaffold200_size39268//21283//22791//NITZ4_007618-RA/size39268-processed-gene-0.7-mRNA-1//1//CDS//3329541292//3507//frame0